jgi:hypothetical protein
LKLSSKQKNKQKSKSVRKLSNRNLQLRWIRSNKKMKSRSKCYNNKLNRLRQLTSKKLKKKEKKHKKEKLRILLLPYKNNKLKSIWKLRKKDKRDSLPMKKQEKLEKNCIKKENRLIWKSRRQKSKNIKDIWRSLMPKLRKKRLKRKMKLIMLKDKRSWTNWLLNILSLMWFRWHNRVHLRL